MHINCALTNAEYNHKSEVLTMNLSFRDLIEKGKGHKESGQTNLALDVYKQALNKADTDLEKEEVWRYVLHIHTDKMLAALIKIAEVFNCSVSDLKNSETGEQFEWIFGTNRFKQGCNNPNIEGYVKPNDSSLFR